MANPIPGYSFEWTSRGGNNYSSIGANCHRFDYWHPNKNGARHVDRILIDMGAGSGDYGAWGYHRILPDVRDDLKRTDKIFLTHAHSDHVEAIFYYIVSPLFTSRGGEEMGFELPPIWGTAYTIEKVKQFLEVKMGRVMQSKSIPDAHKADMWKRFEKCTDNMRILYPGQTIRAGKEMHVTAVPVSHSTLHCVGYLIQTPSATVFHSADFNVDKTYLQPSLMDDEDLKEMGEAGIDVALIDSTGADKTQQGREEAEVRESLIKIIEENPNKRAVITVMGGHDQRSISLMKVAVQTERELFIAGGTMKLTFDLFQKLGLVPANLKVHFINRPGHEKRVPKNKAIVVTTGSQGERGTPLARALTETNYRKLTLHPDEDVVIFSSSFLGINRARTTPLLNALHKRKIKFYSQDNCDLVLNASGHARAPGIRKMLGLLKPRYGIPVHGMIEGRSEGRPKGLLQYCGALMKSMGIKPIYSKNGQTWRLDHPNGPTMVRDNGHNHQWIGVSVLYNQQDRTEEYKFTLVKPDPANENRKNRYNVGRSFDHTV